MIYILCSFVCRAVVKWIVKSFKSLPLKTKKRLTGLTSFKVQVKWPITPRWVARNVRPLFFMVTVCLACKPVVFSTLQHKMLVHQCHTWPWAAKQIKHEGFTALSFRFNAPKCDRNGDTNADERLDTTHWRDGDIQQTVFFQHIMNPTPAVLHCFAMVFLKRLHLQWCL